MRARTKPNSLEKKIPVAREEIRPLLGRGGLLISTASTVWYRMCTLALQSSGVTSAVGRLGSPGMKSADSIILTLASLRCVSVCM